MLFLAVTSVSAIILTVLLVKTILLPLSIKAAKTQWIVREIEPKLERAQKKKA